jgi:hypothetical protein
MNIVSISSCKVWNVLLWRNCKYVLRYSTWLETHADGPPSKYPQIVLPGFASDPMTSTS